MSKREWLVFACLMLLGWSLLEVIGGEGEGWLFPAVMSVLGLMVVL